MTLFDMDNVILWDLKEFKEYKDKAGFQYKMSHYQYRNSHYKDETVSRLSHICNGNP